MNRTTTTDWEAALKAAEQGEAAALKALQDARANLTAAREELQRVRAQAPLSAYEAAGRLTPEEAKQLREANETLAAADAAMQDARARWGDIERAGREWVTVQYANGRVDERPRSRRASDAERVEALHERNRAEALAEEARRRWLKLHTEVSDARQARRNAAARAEAEATAERQAKAGGGVRHEIHELQRRLGMSI